MMSINPRHVAAIARLLLEPKMDKNERAILRHIIAHGAFKDPTEKPDSGWYIGIGWEGEPRYYARRANREGVRVSGSLYLIVKRMKLA